MQSHTSARGGLAALLIGAAGIGCAPILFRWSELGPAATAFYRLLFALPVLGVWLAMENHGRDRPVRARSAWPQFLLAGTCFAGDLALWHWSLELTSVANSTLLTNFAPLFVTLGAWVFLREHVTRWFVMGLVLALGGAAMLVGANVQVAPRNLAGDGVALITAVFYAGYLVTVKHLRFQFSTVQIMTFTGLVSCPVLLAIAVVTGERLLCLHARGWWVLISMALVSHVGGQGLIAYGIGHLPASFSSLSLLMQPVVAAFLAWGLLHEPLSRWQALGGVVVLAGIALAGKNPVRAPGLAEPAKASTGMCR